MSAAAAPVASRAGVLDGLAPALRRNAWILGLLVFLVALLALTRAIQPTYGPIALQGLGTSVLPLALAAVAQAIIVIAGGIDLSIGSMMALTSVISASLMEGQSGEFAVLVVVGVLALGLVLGFINGGLVVVTRVPDIVVTLAMSFVWAGFALLVRTSPGGEAASWLTSLVIGSVPQRVGAQGVGRAGGHRRGHLDPDQPVEVRPGPVRHRQQPAGRLPERRATSVGRRSAPT